MRIFETDCAVSATAERISVVVIKDTLLVVTTIQKKNIGIRGVVLELIYFFLLGTTKKVKLYLSIY